MQPKSLAHRFVRQLGPEARSLRAKLRRRIGFDLVRFDPTRHPLARRMALLRAHGVDVVFDVGANVGQYATELRGLGYGGRVVSFEPLPSAFASLSQRAARDPLWDVFQIGLGDTNAHVQLNVSANSQSSSLLPMTTTHLDAAPESRVTGTEQVMIRRLDDVIDDYVAPESRLYLKIDAQGYERKILEGLGPSHRRVLGAQLEMSLVRLYDGEDLLSQLLDYMSALGFVLMSVEPGFSDTRTGQLLQLDGVFYRQQSSSWEPQP